MTKMVPPRANTWLDTLIAYKPGGHSVSGNANPVRLASNESPLGPSPKAVEAAQRAVGNMHRYADGGTSALRAALGAHHDLDPERIICGTGSDDILQLLAMAYAVPGDEIIHTQYGFMMYPISAKRCGAIPISVPEKNYTADVDAILAHVTAKTRIIYLANPNNPTGTILPASEIKRLHDGLPSDVILVVDAAYAEYVDMPDYDAGLALAHSAPNVIMTRTFSKLYGLAGERVGWAYSCPEIIEALGKIRGPFNITTAGQAAAIAALEDAAWTAQAKAHNDEWLSWLAAQLTDMGLEPIPSQGNFILTKFASQAQAQAANDFLLKNGIIVRYLAGMGLVDCLRITVGTEAETKAVVNALKAFLDTQ